MQSWHLPVMLCSVREFPAHQEGAYIKQKIRIERKEVNSISVGPGRKVTLFPVQELVASEVEMKEFCKAALKRGIVLWAGNSVHSQYLRLD